MFGVSKTAKHVPYLGTMLVAALVLVPSAYIALGGEAPTVNAGPYGPNPPGAPTGTTATNSGSTAIDVAWTAPSDNGGAAITNYEVYRGTSSGGESFLTETGNVLSYHDTSVTLGTTYFYRVAAKNSAGIGAQSNEASAKAANAPGAPTLTATNTGSSSISLTWTAAAANGASVTAYKLYRGTTSGGETLYQTLGNVLSYSDTGVTLGTTYFYKVSAVNSVGEGSQSTEKSALAANAPSAPTNMATNVTGSVSTSPFINVTWTAAAANGAAVTSYKVYRSTTSGAETLVATLGNVLFYNDTSLALGTTYFYKVSAVNSVGEGSQSSEVSRKSVAIPGSATGLVVSNAPNHPDLVLTWTNGAGNGGIDSVNIYRCDAGTHQTPACTPTFEKTLTGSPTTYTDTAADGLVQGHWYYYSVSDANAAGEAAHPNSNNGKA